MARVTKRDMFVEIANALEANGAPIEMVEFVDHEIALIDKRKSAPRKPSKNQVENENLKAQIVDELPAEGATATEIANGLEVSVQRTSQLLRQLVDAGLVTRVEGKGKTKTQFVLAE
jgi:DNA-binding transcriptional ArsR family regulator